MRSRVIIGKAINFRMHKHIDFVTVSGFRFILTYEDVFSIKFYNNKLIECNIKQTDVRCLRNWQGERGGTRENSIFFYICVR